VADLKPELVQALKQNEKDGKISCTAARKIAEELQIPVRVVGDAANELNIKIKGCELGCF